MADGFLPDLVKELAPTGRLRAAINFGNSVLAQPDPAGGPPRGGQQRGGQFRRR